MYFTLSCELVGRLTNIKRWKLSNAHMPGRWRGGRWSEKCQLGRCRNQRWGAQAQTHQQDVLAQWFVDITDFFPDTTIFTIRKLALRTNYIKRKRAINQSNRSIHTFDLSLNLPKYIWTILNESETLKILANVPIIFTYYAESEISRSTGQYVQIEKIKTAKFTILHCSCTNSQ